MLVHLSPPLAYINVLQAQARLILARNILKSWGNFAWLLLIRTACSRILKLKAFVKPRIQFDSFLSWWVCNWWRHAANRKIMYCRIRLGLRLLEGALAAAQWPEQPKERVTTVQYYSQSICAIAYFPSPLHPLLWQLNFYWEYLWPLGL